MSSQLLSSDIEVFKEHLSARSTSISAAIKSIAAQDEDTKPETEELSAQLSQRLAAEKDHLNKLEALRQEQESLEKRLETATSRYMLAEKKLDRAKSATVAKLEAQAMATSQAQSSSPVEGSSSIEQNGTAVDSAALSRAEEAREQAEAASAKQKEQLELIAAENEKLTAQLTAASSKPNTFTDDDYAKTDLFKQLKMQHEDVIKRVNDLEATNIELRKEAERLQSERTLNRNQLENEHSGPSSEKDLMIGRLEADLARIRSARDELHTKVQVQEQSDEQERTSIAQLKQFSEAKEERIRSLEAEIERLSAQPTDTGIEDLSPEETKTKFATLQKQYTMLMEELQGAGAAYKKLQASASAKINSQVELEDRAKRALAEKNKADQKYFATLKTKDTFRSEVVALRAQASKSSDLILQLREADQSSKSLITNLEAEIAKTKELLDQSTRHSSKAQAELAEHVAGTSSLRSQMGDLRAQLEAKDAIVNDVRNAKRKAEVEVEELRVSVRDRDKKLEASKKSKSAGGADSETEMLRVSERYFGRLEILLMIIRLSPCAPSVATISRTQPSQPADTLCAKRVSKKGSPAGVANVRIATNLSDAMST